MLFGFVKNGDILLMDDVGAEKDKYLCYGTLVTPVADIIDHRYIRQLITAIPTLDNRWIRAEKEFTDACNIPGVDPALIHRHANRVRLIVVELVGKLEYLIKLLGESHEKTQ